MNGATQIKQDTNGNGQFNSGDNTIEYKYDSTNYKILYYPDVIDNPSSYEELTDAVITSDTSFSSVASALNQVDVTIQARKKPEPEHPASLDNPEATLTSSIVLRAMSCN